MADDAKVQITIAADLDGSVAASANAAKEQIDQLAEAAQGATGSFAGATEATAGLAAAATASAPAMETAAAGAEHAGGAFITMDAAAQVGERMFERLTLAAAVFGAIDFEKSAFGNAADIQRTADMLGLTTDQVQAFQYAMRQAGADTDTGTMALRRFMSNMGELQSGGEEASAVSDAIRTIGLTADELAGDPFAALQKVAQGILNEKDATTQAYVEHELFGRSGQELNAVLSQLAGGFDNLRQKASDAGEMMDSHTTKGALDAEIAVENATTAIKAMMAEGLVDWADAAGSAFETLSGHIHNAVAAFDEWITKRGLAANLRPIDTTSGTADTAALDSETAALNAAGQNFKAAVASGDGIHGAAEQLKAAEEGLRTAVSTSLRDSATTNAGDIRAAVAALKAAENELRSTAAGAVANVSKQIPAPGAPQAPQINIVSEKQAQDQAKKAAELAQRLSDTIAQDAEQLSLKQIGAAESANNFELQMGDESLDQWKANATEEANAKLAAELAYLQKKAAADKGNVVEEQKDLDAIKAAHQENADALAAIDQQYAEKKRAIDQQELQEFISADNAKLADGIRALDAEYKEHQITAQQRYTLEQQLTEQIYAEELKRLDALLATLTQGTKAWQQAMDERQKLEQQLTKQSETNTNQLAEEESQKWTQLGNSIESSFNSSINGMLLQGKTFEQSMRTLLQGVLGAFLQLAEEMAETWLVTQAKNLLASMTTDTQQTQAAAAAAAAQTATVATQKGALVGLAGAGGVASMAAAPYPLDLTAPAFGASMAADAASYAALATGAYNVPRDMPAYIHAGEMVIPRTFAEDLRSNISGGGYQLSDIAGFFGFATGADNIPNNMVANIHKGEMIVPAAPAQALRARLGSHQLSDIVGGGMDGYELADRARTQSGYQLSDMARGAGDGYQLSDLIGGKENNGYELNDIAKQSFGGAGAAALDSSHFGGGNVTNNGGDTHFHVGDGYAPRITAPNQTVHDLVRNNYHEFRSEMMRMVKDGIRNGSLRF